MAKVAAAINFWYITSGLLQGVSECFWARISCIFHRWAIITTSACISFIKQYLKHSVWNGFDTSIFASILSLKNNIHQCMPYLRIIPHKDSIDFSHTWNFSSPKRCQDSCIWKKKRYNTGSRKFNVPLSQRSSLGAKPSSLIVSRY